jgi:hypothetical protein
MVLSHFQTLPSKELRTYTSKESLWPGCHLNVANPLWQSFTASKRDHYELKEKFKELIRTCDPVVADYYRSLAQAFRELKNSSNPALRAYYLAAYHRSQAASCAAKVEKRSGNCSVALKKLSDCGNIAITK